jgi:hypothetical protein
MRRLIPVAIVLAIVAAGGERCDRISLRHAGKVLAVGPAKGLSER